MDILGAERNYASPSVKDLLEARDLYHYHLTHKASVFGAAVGVYLIRKSDSWPARKKGQERLVPVDKAALRRFYEEKDFVPSLTLDQIGGVLRA